MLEEDYKGGNITEALKADPHSSHQGFVALTPGHGCYFPLQQKYFFALKLTKLLYEVTVIDAFLRAEGGQQKSGWLLFFLLFLLEGKCTHKSACKCLCNVNISSLPVGKLGDLQGGR